MKSARRTLLEVHVLPRRLRHQTVTQHPAPPWDNALRSPLWNAMLHRASGWASA